jgi:hypothetical protein
LAAEAAPAVTSALAGGWTAGTLLEAVNTLASTVRAGAEGAFHWALQALGFPVSQEVALAAALTAPVTTAVDAGWDAKVSPGTALPEEMLRQGALGEALANLRVDLQGVSETSVTEIGDQLAASVAAGENTAQATARIDGVLHDEKRAEVVARTEIARAMEGAMLAMAKATGGMDKEWLDAPGACPVCVANAAQGAIPLTRPFNSGDQHPPAHPRCRCATALVPYDTA